MRSALLQACRRGATFDARLAVFGEHSYFATRQVSPMYAPFQQLRHVGGRTSNDSTAEVQSEAHPDAAAMEIMEKGTKRMAQSEKGREQLERGTFDLEGTTHTVLKEGEKELREEEGGHTPTADKAQEGAERMQEGEESEVSRRVKQNVIGTLGETS